MTQQGHEHPEGPDAGHRHDHARDLRQDDPESPPMDAAGANLARALRMSFRLLTVIMVGVLVLFLFTGVTCVETGQKGVITVLGRQVAVVGPGLHFTWPFPVGDLRTVSTAKRTMEILDFWPQLSPQDMAKADLSEVQPPDKGLRPGWDGALLTGDAYLLHVRVQCVFEVEDAAAYLSGLREPNEAELREPSEAVRSAVRSAVCRAAVHAAATRTAEGLMLSDEQERFKAQVLTRAQRSLDQMKAGVRLTQVNTDGWTWPIRALADYKAAQQADQMRSKAVSGAIGEARNLLNNAAGPNYRKLVGDAWLEPNSPSAAAADPNEYDLIGQYELARLDPNASPDAAEKLLARIDEVLWDPSTQGEVTAIRRAAESEKDAQVSAVAARADSLQKLLAEYQKAPDFFLHRMWTETREEILRSPTVVKWFLTPTSGKTIVQLNVPPEIVKDMTRWWLQTAGPQPPGPTPQPGPRAGEGP